MRLSKRKRLIIIKLAENELESFPTDKKYRKNLRSIITRMQASIRDTEVTDKEIKGRDND